MIFHKQLKLEDKNPCHDMQVAVRGQRPWRPDMVRTDAFDADSGKALERIKKDFRSALQPLKPNAPLPY